MNFTFAVQMVGKRLWANHALSIASAIYEGTNQETNNPGRIQLFLESEDESLFNFGDNLFVTPFGDLIVCEDQYTDLVDNYLHCFTPKGELYNFARLHEQTELAGRACFSPDGTTMFVNIYSPAKTQSNQRSVVGCFYISPETNE